MHAAALARDFAQRRGGLLDARAGSRRSAYLSMSANTPADGLRAGMAAYDQAVSLVYRLTHRTNAPVRISQVFTTHTHHLQVLLRFVQQTIMQIMPIGQSGGNGNAGNTPLRQWRAGTTRPVRNTSKPSQGGWPVTASSIRLVHDALTRSREGRPASASTTLRIGRLTPERARPGGHPAGVLALAGLQPAGYLLTSHLHAHRGRVLSLRKLEQTTRSLSGSRATATLALETIERMLTTTQRTGAAGSQARSHFVSGEPVLAARDRAWENRLKFIASVRPRQLESLVVLSSLRSAPLLRSDAGLPDATHRLELPASAIGPLGYRLHQGATTLAIVRSEATRMKAPDGTVRVPYQTRIDRFRQARDDTRHRPTAEKTTRITSHVEIDRFARSALRLVAGYRTAPLDRDSPDAGHAMTLLQHYVSATTARAPTPLARYRPTAAQASPPLARYNPAWAPQTGFAWRQPPGFPAAVIQREIRRIESTLQTRVVREILHDSHHQHQLRTAVSDVLLSPGLVQTLARRIQDTLERHASIERYRKETR